MEDKKERKDSGIFWLLMLTVWLILVASVLIDKSRVEAFMVAVLGIAIGVAYRYERKGGKI